VLTAFVLAGGRSTRMGQDKAFLMLAGRTLLDRALALARSLTPDVWIAGETATFAAFGPVVEDTYRQRGPLGGIHAALRQSTNELNLMLAVDMPFIDRRFLEYLVAQARASRATVTVPRVAAGWQPLCAVYRREFAETAEKSLREGKNKIDSLFLPLSTRAITEEEVLRNGFSLEMFRNLNTPEELGTARISVSEAVAKSS
jgi:molybdopterin-guanine dinucleotide biosynthesis protein A